MVRTDWCAGLCSGWTEDVDQADEDGLGMYGAPTWEDWSSESLLA